MMAGGAAVQIRNWLRPDGITQHFKEVSMSKYLKRLAGPPEACSKSEVRS